MPRQPCCIQSIPVHYPPPAASGRCDSVSSPPPPPPPPPPTLCWRGAEIDLSTLSRAVVNNYTLFTRPVPSLRSTFHHNLAPHEMSIYRVSGRPVFITRQWCDEGVLKWNTGSTLEFPEHVISLYHPKII